MSAGTEPPEAVPADTSAAPEANEPDLATLNAQADYTPFLGQGVRPEVRSAALRKLWSSEPIFSQSDGLQDYAGDFTDSATVPSGPIATAYQIGWGVAGRAPGQEDAANQAEPEQSDGGPSEAGEPTCADERPRCADAPATGRGRAKA